MAKISLAMPVLLVMVSQLTEAQVVSAGDAFPARPPEVSSLHTSNAEESLQLSVCGRAMVSGAMEGFLGPAAQLNADELQCLETQIEQTASRVEEVSRTLISSSRRTVLLLSKALGSSEVSGAEVIELVGAEQSAASTVSKLAHSMYEFIQIEEEIARECVKKETLQALGEAGQHLLNASYVRSHIIANGVDIATELADAIKSFDNHDYHKLGQEMGLAWRKVLLAPRASLPQGAPSLEELEDISEGMLEGFFGPGFVLKVSSDAMGAQSNFRGVRPEGWTIDVHQCVARNKKEFQKVMNEVSQLMAKQALSSLQDFAENLEFALGAAIFDLPRVLRRCNVHREQEEMLADSILALQTPKLRVKSSAVWQPTEDGVQHFAQTAVLAWEARRWKDCGEDLGGLLRELVLRFLPEQYSVDDSGRMKRQIQGLLLEQFPQKSPAERRVLVDGLWMAMALPAFVVSMVVLRCWHSSPSQHKPLVERRASRGERRPFRRLEPILEVDEDESLCVE